MKKSLIALAAVAAVSAASAQSSVTVYGVIDAGITRDTGGLNPAASSITRLDNGVMSGSRLGFRGVEDLGGGLKANFLAETGFCADSAATAGFCTGGGAFMGREARVGLSGGFGSLDLGRQYTPAFIVLTTVDPFGTGLGGQVSNLMDSAGGYATLTNPGGAYGNSGNPRMNNTVKFSSANYGGFSASVAYGFGEVAGNNSAGRNAGFNATYANGPLYVGLAYHAANAAAPVAGVLDQRKNVLIGATYNFGVATAHAMYGTTKNAIAQGLVAGNTAGSINNGDGRNLMVGVSVPFGPGKFLASYINHDDKGVNKFDANQFGLGYMYSLSKRTTVYTAYSKISNKNGAFYTVGNAANNGIGNAAFNLGVRHTF
jgi:predicted porin